MSLIVFRFQKYFLRPFLHIHTKKNNITRTTSTLREPKLPDKSNPVKSGVFDAKTFSDTTK